jgi:hypothetical protein
MKFALALAALMTVSSFAQAGDNGAYTKCVSKSGRTILEMGNVGSLSNPQTVELKIDGKTYGPGEIDGEIGLTVKGDYLIFTELDHEGTNWVTIKMSKAASNGSSRGLIVSGLDPRTNKPLDSQISVKCDVVYNPI